MTGLPIKPALCAGFLLMQSLDVSAQEYVDVEAERRAAAQAVTADVAEGAAVEPVSPTYGGIQPYSGSTTVAQPLLEVDNNPITGTDSGSLILRVQQLEADVRMLTGLLEEATQALRALEAQSLERYVDLDRRLSVVARPQEENVATAGPGSSIPASGESPGAHKVSGRVKRRKERRPLIVRPMSWYVSENSIRLSALLWSSCQIIHLGVTHPMPTIGWGSFIWLSTRQTLNSLAKTLSCCLINTLPIKRCQTHCIS